MTSPALPVAAPKISGRAWILAVLTLTYTFNHVDRQILVILLEPIKTELGLRDSQLGMLSGLAFAAFYATLGIPVAMWADRGNRRNIIALALGLWSAMTAFSGLAQNYWQLLLARMGVGVGEAGGTPPATSMIADLYPPQERATALGIYTAGIGLGIMAGFALGGYVYELYGWRVAFFVAGIPGLILALIVRFGIREPVRGLADQRQDDSPAPSLGETLKFIFGQSSYLWLMAGCLLICISANAFLVFTSSLLQRTYDLSPGQVSLPLGVLIGGVGSIGAIVLGRVCDTLSKKDLRWRPLIIALCAAVALPFAWMFLRAPSVELAYAWNIVPSFIGLIYASVAYTASQELVKLRMRSFASAFMLFCLTLIGIGCGPWIAGELSDHFLRGGAERPLARALEVILLFNAASIVCLLMATRKYRSDAERAAL
ncbi:major facilitator family transporter [Hyphomonas neptunium ATCC 15444]|uniref:Major facilitator family transporter n=2 Tax=Hyphomonas TaxID=85 RepID=Q0BXR4_HYPNA|nr:MULTISPECIES: MFS transporter [Hyphomonas]ABI78610.1 major facilitator family transporter [Hyphomonas neptunium ATCC 15444]KCZ93581.1 major facilitator family transporter [Hyphomonas hirschiana VP5]